MSALMIVQVVCMLVSAGVVMPQLYYNFEEQYAEPYYDNEIVEGDQSEGECALTPDTL